MLRAHNFNDIKVSMIIYMESSGIFLKPLLAIGIIVGDFFLGVHFLPNATFQVTSILSFSVYHNL
jgi:hypothetical protein